MKRGISDEGLKRVAHCFKAQAIPTKNPDFGFSGTLGSPVDSSSIWNTTIEIIQQEFPEVSPEDIREFLDSRDGRGFADTVNSLMDQALPGLISQALSDWGKDSIKDFFENVLPGEREEVF